ncbi:hypothetical protein E1265_34320 [Streptomyces sp. 8K308]|nr:hypothetical protein E1265_34320 [Streptomyces sp. 8K308]
MLVNTGLTELATDPRHALGLLFEAKEHYAAAGAPRNAASTIHHLALAHEALGREDHAEALWWRAVAECRHEGEERTSALALTALAQRANNTERYSEGAALASTAYDTLILNSPAPDQHGAALAQTQWARAEAGAGNDDRARDLLNAAIETLSGLGASLPCGKALMQLAAVHIATGRVPQALDCYHFGAHLARDRGDMDGLVSIQRALDAIPRHQPTA